MFSYSCQIRYVAYKKQSHNILILLSKKKTKQNREIEKYQQLCAEGISIALTEHWKAAREQMGYGSRRI